MVAGGDSNSALQLMGLATACCPAPRRSRNCKAPRQAQTRPLSRHNDSPRLAHALHYIASLCCASLYFTRPVIKRPDGQRLHTARRAIERKSPASPWPAGNIIAAGEPAVKVNAAPAPDALPARLSVSRANALPPQDG